MIYLLFLVALLLICCNPDQAKDNSKDETIEYFIPLSHRVEKDVDEMFEEYRYVPLETRDDALTYFTKSETSPSSKRTYTSALMTF